MAPISRWAGACTRWMVHLSVGEEDARTIRCTTREWYRVCARPLSLRYRLHLPISRGRSRGDRAAVAISPLPNGAPWLCVYRYEVRERTPASREHDARLWLPRTEAGVARYSIMRRICSKGDQVHFLGFSPFYFDFRRIMNFFKYDDRTIGDFY